MGGRVCVAHIGAVGKQNMVTVPTCVRVHLSRPWDGPRLTTFSGDAWFKSLWFGQRRGFTDIALCVAEALVKTLASYEVVIPARVNEFGDVFPQNRHFSRKKRSSGVPEPTPLRTHYRISAYGQLFQLNLSADSAFLAAGYTEVHLGTPAAPGSGGGSAEPPDLRHCFYRGQVNAREDHTAVFSLCGGLVSLIVPPIAFSCDPVQGCFGGGAQWFLLSFSEKLRGTTREEPRPEAERAISIHLSHAPLAIMSGLWILFLQSQGRLFTLEHQCWAAVGAESPEFLKLSQ